MTGNVPYPQQMLTEMNFLDKQIKELIKELL